MYNDVYEGDRARERREKVENGASEIFARAVFPFVRDSLTPCPSYIHRGFITTYELLYSLTFALNTTREAAALRADGASGGRTWRERVASVRHANCPSTSRPRAGRGAVALPYKGIAQSEQLSSRGGSRHFPASKASRPDCNRNYVNYRLNLNLGYSISWI